jgi:hypothetical protein
VKVTRQTAGWAIVGLAAAAGLMPLPAGWVERSYSRGFYPMLQHHVTRVSNLIPFALFDGLCLAVIAAAVIAGSRRVRAFGRGRGLIILAGDGVRAAAALYLLFLACWGLNYRRLPLTAKLDFNPARVTREAARALSVTDIASLNALYHDAHARPVSDAELAALLHRAEEGLGDPSPTVPGRPKPTLLGGYFHAASISGMTDPFFLETLLAPDLLDVERPFVTLHEWAHLAGYADESEANFVAWRACLLGPPATQYSAWFVVLGYVEGFLPRGARAPDLDAGPRGDLLAARYRSRGASPIVKAAAQRTYDQYLKANRVPGGIVSYDLVVQLILGTNSVPARRPQ